MKSFFDGEFYIVIPIFPNTGMASKFLQGVAMEYGDNKLQGEKRRNGAHTVSVLITQRKP